MSIQDNEKFKKRRKSYIYILGTGHKSWLGRGGTQMKLLPYKEIGRGSGVGGRLGLIGTHVGLISTRVGSTRLFRYQHRTKHEAPTRELSRCSGI